MKFNGLRHILHNNYYLEVIHGGKIVDASFGYNAVTIENYKGVINKIKLKYKLNKDASENTLIASLKQDDEVNDNLEVVTSYYSSNWERVLKPKIAIINGQYYYISSYTTKASFDITNIVSNNSNFIITGVELLDEEVIISSAKLCDINGRNIDLYFDDTEKTILSIYPKIYFVVQLDIFKSSSNTVKNFPDAYPIYYFGPESSILTGCGVNSKGLYGNSLGSEWCDVGVFYDGHQPINSTVKQQFNSKPTNDYYLIRDLRSLGNNLNYFDGYLPFFKNVNKAIGFTKSPIPKVSYKDLSTISEGYENVKILSGGITNYQILKYDSLDSYNQKTYLNTANTIKRTNQGQEYEINYQWLGLITGIVFPGLGVLPISTDVRVTVADADEPKGANRGEIFRRTYHTYNDGNSFLYGNFIYIPEHFIELEQPEKYFIENCDSKIVNRLNAQKNKTTASELFGSAGPLYEIYEKNSSKIGLHCNHFIEYYKNSFHPALIFEEDIRRNENIKNSKNNIIIMRIYNDNSIKYNKKVEFDTPFFSELIKDKAIQRSTTFYQHVPFTYNTYCGAESVIPSVQAAEITSSIGRDNSECWHGFYGYNMYILEDINNSTFYNYIYEYKNEETIEQENVNSVTEKPEKSMISVAAPQYFTANYAVCGEYLVPGGNATTPTLSMFTYKLEYKMLPLEEWKVAIDFTDASKNYQPYTPYFFNKAHEGISAPYWRITSNISSGTLYGGGNSTFGDKLIGDIIHQNAHINGYDPNYMFIGYTPSEIRSFSINEGNIEDNEQSLKLEYDSIAYSGGLMPVKSEVRLLETFIDNNRIYNEEQLKNFLNINTNSTNNTTFRNNGDGVVDDYELFDDNKKLKTNWSNLLDINKNNKNNNNFELIKFYQSLSTLEIEKIVNRNKDEKDFIIKKKNDLDEMNQIPNEQELLEIEQMKEQLGQAIRRYLRGKFIYGNGDLMSATCSELLYIYRNAGNNIQEASQAQCNTWIFKTSVPYIKNEGKIYFTTQLR